MIINDDSVRKLADLARIKLSNDDVRGLVRDFDGILGYFEELKEVDTRGVDAMSGGAFSVNAHRHDGENTDTGASRDDLVRQFPEKDGDYLKVPPVFTRQSGEEGRKFE